MIKNILHGSKNLLLHNFCGFISSFQYSKFNIFFIFTVVLIAFINLVKNAIGVFVYVRSIERVQRQSCKEFRDDADLPYHFFLGSVIKIYR